MLPPESVSSRANSFGNALSSKPVLSNDSSSFSETLSSTAALCSFINASIASISSASELFSSCGFSSAPSRVPIDTSISSIS